MTRTITAVLTALALTATLLAAPAAATDDPGTPHRVNAWSVINEGWEPDPEGEILHTRTCLAVIVSASDRHLIDSISAAALTSTAPSVLLLSDGTYEQAGWIAHEVIRKGIEIAVIVGGEKAVPQIVADRLGSRGASLLQWRAAGETRLETAEAASWLATEFMRGDHYDFNRHCRWWRPIQ